MLLRACLLAMAHVTLDKFLEAVDSSKPDDKIIKAVLDGLDKAKITTVEALDSVESGDIPTEGAAATPAGKGFLKRAIELATGLVGVLVLSIIVALVVQSMEV